MAAEQTNVNPEVIIPQQATAPTGKPPITNGSSNSRPSSSSAGHAHAIHAILSRTGLARSEGFLRPISDTPPTAPASPRMGP
jgi:hypothetical protein